MSATTAQLESSEMWGNTLGNVPISEHEVLVLVIDTTYAVLWQVSADEALWRPFHFLCESS